MVPAHCRVKGSKIISSRAGASVDLRELLGSGGDQA
jgi:hypothetical protein